VQWRIEGRYKRGIQLAGKEGNRSEARDAIFVRSDNE
jgi:hypothetical protein